jgi:uncharacterized BrkB/YihY/UPF0761 family membrane protein
MDAMRQALNSSLDHPTGARSHVSRWPEAVIWLFGVLGVLAVIAGITFAFRNNDRHVEMKSLMTPLLTRSYWI